MALFGIEFVIVFIMFGLLYWHFKARNVGKYPPWRRGLPLLGMIPFLGSHPYKKLADMKKEYGNIFMVSIGRKPVLVLNNWETVKEALIGKAEIFARRPHSFLFNYTVNNKDINTADVSPTWKQLRAFSLSVLRDMGVGKYAAEELIAGETEDLLNRLKVDNGKEIDGENPFFVPILNVTWKILCGRRFLNEDKSIQEFYRILIENFKHFDSANIINSAPFLRYLVPGGFGFWKLVENHNKLWRFLQKEVEDHKTTYVFGNEPRDFVEAFLGQIIRHKEINPSHSDEKNAFTEYRLLCVLYDFFSASIETTSYTLSWGIMYMAMWLDIQAKVHQELDQVIGSGRLPTFNDRPKLPYCEATLLEIQRYTSLVPMSLPHRAGERTTLGGFDIPENITVLPNLWAVHHDAQVWGDPNVFRPERFLTTDGRVQKPEYLIPFSAGPRTCLGEKLARMEMWIFFTGAMQRFSFRFPRGTPPPSMEPIVGLTLRPQPFKVVSVLR